MTRTLSLASRLRYALIICMNKITENRQGEWAPGINISIIIIIIVIITSETRNNNIYYISHKKSTYKAKKQNDGRKGYILMPYTAVSRKVVLQTGKSLRDNVESCYGQWWFYGYLSEPQGVSVWWKETAQTHVFVLSRSLSIIFIGPQMRFIKILL